MNLKVINIPKHLSPSSFKEWSLCQTKFALKRMMGLPYPEYYQTLAAACGSAFDVYVKRDIAVRLGQGDDPRFALETMMAKSVEPHNSEALVIGKKLYDAYRSNGCINALMNEGFASIELADKKDLIITNEDGEPEVVPTNGLPDGAFKDGKILDFKVQGAVSKSGASPNPGYSRSVCNGVQKWGHERSGEPLEALNIEWAEQMVIYSWMQGGVQPWRVLQVAIENITVRGDKITCSSIRTHITKEFQQRMWERYYGAWRAISAGEIADASPSDRVCFNYQAKCEVAEHCPAFTKWQENKASGNPLSYLK